MPLGLFLILLYLVFLTLLVGVVLSFAAVRRARGIRRPVKERMLRPAGTSLAEKLSELNENAMMWFALAVIVPIGAATSGALGVSFMVSVPATKVWAAVLIATVVFVPLAWRFFVVFKRYTNHQLGLSGERAVAEQLQELARGGCYVFHDLQPDKTWNIDHIVVAPESVLVVETKTRRKREKGDETAAHEVIFDGRQLHFPQWSDSHGLEQAQRNAAWVRDFLSKALSEPVKVEAVLALPGWMVKLKGRGAVYVVNPKEVRALVRARGIHAISPESEKRMKQIAFALEQKCRDVEF
ncbi:MAG: nuclease-related domain-containing protein [Chthoniobacteraceae bacterium]